MTGNESKGTAPAPNASEDATEALAQGVLQGDRRALARAITLIESARPDHRARAEALLGEVTRAARAQGREALRIGLSGTPGVGKSTFTEGFGMMLIEAGLSVAVLAVDPSSARSGGSILGDKTRMPQLARAPRAFIRPSPAGKALGGVARRSRESVALCEAAGFDVVLIETVGVGQSETLVAGMCDLFTLLIAPAGGDELQGVKRGIMEIADLIVVNKADGDLAPAAQRTRADYAAALGLMRRRPEDPPGYPMVLPASALTGSGIAEIWEAMQTLAEWRREQGFWNARRAAQARAWFEEEVRHGLLAGLETEGARAELARLGAEVEAGRLLAVPAARQMLARLGRV